MGTPHPCIRPAQPLAPRLANAASRAATIATAVAIPEAAYFTTVRKLIREALAASGIARTIDRLVARLLDG